MSAEHTLGESDAPAEASPRRGDLDSPSAPADATGDDSADPQRQLERERVAWAAEKEILLDMLTQQQRVAQAGLITSGLAHDIRNQAQMIMSTAELSLITDDEAGLKEALRGVTGFCRDIAETTETFLAFVRRQSTVNHQLFAMSDVVEHCRRLATPLAQKNRVILRCEVAEDGLVRGEQRMAIQALVNLATNAVKACAGQDDGEVIVTASRPFDEVCRFTVADTGPGVPESVRSRLFRPLVGTRDTSGGSGLGLFIVRQAVLDLEGRITVKTSPTGSIFRVDLPAVDDRGSTTGPVSSELPQ